MYVCVAAGKHLKIKSPLELSWLQSENSVTLLGRKVDSTTVLTKPLRSQGVLEEGALE